jgi:putative PEP-CTERM system TPR-repeat lipoprotein
MPSPSAASFRNIAAALLLPLGAALSGCDAVNETTDAEDLAQAQTQRSHGEYRKSVITAKNALQKNPNNAAVHQLLSQLALDFGNGETAQAELKRAEELGLPHDALLPLLAQSLLLQGKYQDLLDHIAVPAHMDAKDGARLMAWRGDAWLGLQKPDKARADYESALLLDANAALGKLGLARFAQVEGDSAKAFRLAQEAQASEPDNPEVWSYLGEWHEAAGDLAQAEASYGKAIALRPANEFDRTRRVWTRLAQGKLDAAREDVDALKKQAPNHFLTHFAQGLLLFKEQKPAEAQSEFEQVLKLNEGYVEALYFQGVTHFLQGNFLHAQESLARFNTLAPNTVRGLTMMAMVKFKQGDAAGAIQLLVPVVEHFPGNVPALRLLGNIELARNNYARALGYLSRAVEAGAQAAQAKAARGGSGVGEVESAMASDPGLAQTEVQVVLIHMQQRQYAKALAAIEAMKTRMPRSTLPLNLLAQVRLVQGEPAKAEAALKEALAIDPKDLGALQGLAKFAIQDKRYAEARQHCQAALSARPTDLPSRLCLAELDDLEGKPAAMADEFKQAIQDHPEALAPRLALSRLFNRLGQPRQGLSLLEQSRASFGEQPDFLARLAEAQLENEQPEEALETATRLAKLEPSAARGEYIAALARGRRGDALGMRAGLERALHNDPKFLPAREAMVRLLAAEKKLPEAERQLQALLKELPDNPELLGLKGWLAMIQKRWDVAESAYRASLAKLPSSQTLADLAKVQWFAGNRDAALKTLNDWIGQHPEDSGARHKLAGFYAELGRRPEQIAEFEKAVAADPEDVLALNDLAWELRAEQPARAIKYAERAVALAPDVPQVLDTLAAILLEQGQANKALKMLDQAQQRWPESPLIRYRLAVAQDQQGDPAAAVKTLQELLGGKAQFAERKDAEALLAKLGPR